jgi:hypothetical protein
MNDTFGIDQSVCVNPSDTTPLGMRVGASSCNHLDYPRLCPQLRWVASLGLVSDLDEELWGECIICPWVLLPVSFWWQVVVVEGLEC